MVSALYSMGYSTEEMLEMFKFFSKPILGIGPKYIFENIRETGGFKLGGITTGLNIELAFKRAERETRTK